jgi:multidrug efflux pump subunit AcrA (membrane-fusion protein)
VVSRFGEDYVFVVEKNGEETVVRKRDIVPGISVDGVLEVQQGLLPNDEVVIRGQTLLSDGSRINVIERTAPLSVN